MFTSIDKALVAVIMGLVYLVNTLTPLSIGLSPEVAGALVSVLTPLLVWAVPNRT